MRKVTMMLVLLCCIILPKSVFAAEYTNNNGVVMTDEQYANLLKLYSEKYISVMEQADFDRIMNLNIDYDSTQKTIKYIKTEYNQVTGESVNTEITEAEYESAEEPKTRATVIETSYKRISLGFSKSPSTYAYVTFNAIWKIMPKVRSYDVIGVRLSNMDVINGTQTGRQVYDLNGSTSYVQYSFNGTNIKNLSNGFGISMNIVNSNITYLECNIDSTLDIKSYPAGLFASYQHAVEDVSLATSQNYSIGVGLGNVFVFNNGISSKYDGMEGTYDYLSSAS